MSLHFVVLCYHLSLDGTELQYSQKYRKHNEMKTWITEAFRLTLNRVIRQKENETETISIHI